MSDRRYPREPIRCNTATYPWWRVVASEGPVEMPDVVEPLPDDAWHLVKLGSKARRHVPGFGVVLCFLSYVQWSPTPLMRWTPTDLPVAAQWQRLR